jgi:MraZ protein
LIKNDLHKIVVVPITHIFPQKTFQAPSFFALTQGRMVGSIFSLVGKCGDQRRSSPHFSTIAQVHTDTDSGDNAPSIPGELVAIPVTMRETLRQSYGQESDRIILTLSSREPAIAVYPVSVFNRLMETLQTTTEMDGDGQSLLMLFSASARECPIDKQGRVRLSEDLMAYAELSKEASFCGHFDRMQIWNPERWKAFTRETLATSVERSDRLARSLRRGGQS